MYKLPAMFSSLDEGDSNIETFQKFVLMCYRSNSKKYLETANQINMKAVNADIAELGDVIDFLKVNESNVPIVIVKLDGIFDGIFPGEKPRLESKLESFKVEMRDLGKIKKGNSLNQLVNLRIFWENLKKNLLCQKLTDSGSGVDNLDRIIDAINKKQTTYSEYLSESNVKNFDLSSCLVPQIKKER